METKTVERRQLRRGLGEGNGRRFGGRNSHHGNEAPRRRTPPPEKTHAEEFYYLKQMNAKTPVVVVLTDGEQRKGWIEWYDQDCIKVHSNTEPNVLIFKQHIKYIYKDPEANLDA
ncbi:MAG: hypothetical protein D6718_01160 [Acidobacteria bacterium]|nr:MAG: hypothetical protein D6718_01160 [Acidobacteriota bacterium]